MVGLIYKITNKINGKSYIGQTTQSLNRRINQHLNDVKSNSHLMLHNAIRKYGFENFKVSILEKNVSYELLNDRECYWIKEENTYFETGYGYNMTLGGNQPFNSRKLTDDEISKIQNMLKNNLELTEKEIGDIFKVSFSCISDINLGRSWNDSNIIYPIRKSAVRELEYIEFLEIIKMLESKLFSLAYICNKYNLSISTVSKINTGNYKKFKYPNDLDFPINKIKISNNKISNKNICFLLLDYLSGNFKKKDLALKYNISSNYVKGLYLGNNSSYMFSDLIFPLKDNKLYNIKKLKEKIEFINKYE